ncbi:MAG: chemotaxis protein CheX [Candidatus Krumholzibacteriia bacterium]
MNVAYINPFIESVNELFTTMLGCSAERGRVGLVKPGGPSDDLTALIGLSGPVRGTVALSFPDTTARAMVGRMTGLAEADLGDSLGDGLAELVNIVAGGAKAKLNSGDGAVTDLSLPTVVRGQNYAVEGLTQTTWLDVPFASELGTFTLRVTFEHSQTRAEPLGAGKGRTS